MPTLMRAPWWRPAVVVGCLLLLALAVLESIAVGTRQIPFGTVLDALTDPVAVGIIAGLVIGKIVGITAATWLVARFTRADLDEGLSWTDVLGLAILGGVGFTVSLLIGELAFGEGSEREDHVKIGILVGTIVAIVLGTVVLRARDRAYRTRRVSG